MKTAPMYALYGTSTSDPLADQLHMESIAERSRLHGWEIQPHRHAQFLQILHIRTGGGTALLETQHHALGDGSLVLVPPQCVHGFVFRPDTDGVVITLTDSRLRMQLAGTPDVLPLFAQPWHDRIAPAHPLADALRMFRMEMESLGTWRGATLSSLLTVVLIGIARHIDAHTPHTTPGHSRAARHFQHFQQRLELGYREQKDIGDYARDLGITSTQLNRVCRQVAGQTALQLIHARVLAQAQRDLLFSDLEIKHIALSLGFADAAYFSRFFVQRTGQTPTAFRQAGRASLPVFATQGT